MSLRKVLALGLVAGVAIAGCTVTTSSDTGDGGEGSGGGGNPDASASGGAKASGGAGGAKATGGGGAKATGGSSTTKDSGVGDAGPATCEDVKGDADVCTKCVAAKCCQEWNDCGDNSVCGETEFPCIDACLRKQVGDSGTGILDVEECAGQCQVDTLIADETNAFIACIRGTGDSGTTQNCSTECYGGEL
jgi:hypothetical protein